MAIVGCPVFTAHTAAGGADQQSLNRIGWTPKRSQSSLHSLTSDWRTYSTAYIHFNSNILLAVTHIAPPWTPQ